MADDLWAPQVNFLEFRTMHQLCGWESGLMSHWHPATFSNIIRSTVVTCVPSHVLRTHSDWARIKQCGWILRGFSWRGWSLSFFSECTPMFTRTCLWGMCSLSRSNFYQWVFVRFSSHNYSVLNASAESDLKEWRCQQWLGKNMAPFLILSTKI